MIVFLHLVLTHIYQFHRNSWIDFPRFVPDLWSVNKTRWTQQIIQQLNFLLLIWICTWKWETAPSEVETKMSVSNGTLKGLPEPGNWRTERKSSSSPTWSLPWSNYYSTFLGPFRCTLKVRRDRFNSSSSKIEMVVPVSCSLWTSSFYWFFGLRASVVVIFFTLRLEHPSTQ